MSSVAVTYDKIAAASDGSFVVTNTRNDFQKIYKLRD